MVKAPRNNYMIRAGGTLFACYLLGIGLCPAAQADTVYTYTGNPFNEFSGGAACPPICSISGSFTVATPITVPENQFFVTVSPLEFSFTDGSMTITQANAAQSTLEFTIATDSHGDIVSWFILVGSATSISALATDNGASVAVDDRFACTDTLGVPCVEAFVHDNPGTWTSTSVPEPSTLLLFGTGLLGMLGLYRTKTKSFQARDG